MNKKIYLILGLLFIVNCASHLSVNVIDSDTKEPIEGIIVEAQGPEQRIADETMTGDGGFAEFPNIKSSPIALSVESPKLYFPFDSTYENISLKENIIISLEKLQTIVTGRVEQDTIYRSIPNCEISTLPETETVYSNEDGSFTIKSTKFKDTSYDIIVNHKDYFENRKSSLRFNLNNKTNIGVILLRPKPIEEGPERRDIELWKWLPTNVDENEENREDE